jgi:hypothetical protein
MSIGSLNLAATVLPLFSVPIEGRQRLLKQPSPSRREVHMTQASVTGHVGAARRRHGTKRH